MHVMRFYCSSKMHFSVLIFSILFSFLLISNKNEKAKTTKHQTKPERFQRNVHQEVIYCLPIRVMRQSITTCIQFHSFLALFCMKQQQQNRTQIVFSFGSLDSFEHVREFLLRFITCHIKRVRLNGLCGPVEQNFTLLCGDTNEQKNRTKSKKVFSVDCNVFYLFVRWTAFIVRTILVLLFDCASFQCFSVEKYFNPVVYQ